MNPFCNTQALGKHVIAELYDCDRDIINDHDLVQEIMLTAAEKSGATVVKPVFHKFNPHGVSGVVVISESHFTIHTWPEYGYCALDIFTCGDLVDNAKAFKYMKEAFRAGSISVVEMRRGVVELGVDKQDKDKPRKVEPAFALPA